MLVREDTTELFGIFRLILDQIKVEQKFKQQNFEDTENKSPNNT